MISREVDNARAVCFTGCSRLSNSAPIVLIDIPPRSESLFQLVILNQGILQAEMAFAFYARVSALTLTQ